MGRERAELEELYAKFSEQYREAFGETINTKEFLEVLWEIHKERLRKFTVKRLDHLPDTDFAGLIAIAKEPPKPSVSKPTSQAQAPAEK